MKNNSFKLLKILLLSSITLILSCILIIFSFLYINSIEDGFIKNNSSFLKCVSLFLTMLIATLCVVFILKKQDVVFKIFIIILFVLTILLVMLYILKITNFWDKVNDIEDLRNYISSFGANAIIIFILMQIIQVVILPIPGVVAIGAGVALFGVKMGAFYSLIGILIGSFLAYYIGKFPGERVVGWLVGKGNLEKTLKRVEGKDKFILTFMFLFPFFPDDILCFVAGMSSMSQIYFAIMIIITRIIGVYSTAFSLNGDFIPYDTPWGIALWAILIVLTFIFAFILNKYSKIIEEKLKNRKKK